MATQEIIVDQKPVDLAPIDPSVVIPDHVKKAAALAESFYKQPEAPPVEAAPEAPPEPVVQEATPPAPVETPPLAPQHDYVEPAPKEAIHSDDWAAKYNSMYGRWKAAQQTIGSMQEQMSQMGDELLRLQQMVSQQHVNASNSPVPHQRLITAEDEQAYGPELIDLTRRAAMETVGPELERLRSENNDLKKRVTTSAKGEVRNALAREVPNWQEINKSPEFKNWLRLRNVYTGEVRQSMLNAAYEAADAPKVAAFFKDFLREGVATGRIAPAPQQEQPAPAPRVAAVPLETLSAPGRAKPASGDLPASPADKPIYTRAQVATFYDHVRRGAYVGRETEKARLEASIFAAQAEGRVR